MAEAVARTYTVEGMSCDHCVASVSREVASIDGVDRAEVDLATGRLVVSGARLDDDAVQAAVERAGYRLA